MVTPRREIKTRDAKWAQSLAKFVAEKTNLTPNDISIISVLFAAIVFAVYCGYNFLPQDLFLWIPIIAIFGIQMRLICNLIDGMVAVEGGKKSALGDIYNEFTDRISDTLIIVGLGIAGGTWYSISLGLFAALLAMLTAYTRVLGGAIGANQYFTGPMAKQHRMALITIATIICLGEYKFYNLHQSVACITLLIIIAGCILTVNNRIKKISKDLVEKNQ